MKVYISRDEDSDNIWIWLQPRKGSWKPEPISPDSVNFQRESMNEIDRYCCYDKDVFKEKFKIPVIREKTCKCVHLPDNLVMDIVGVKHGLFAGKLPEVKKSKTVDAVEVLEIEPDVDEIDIKDFETEN
jgi:hypothetical protein